MRSRCKWFETSAAFRGHHVSKKVPRRKLSAITERRVTKPNRFLLTLNTEKMPITSYLSEATLLKAAKIAGITAASLLSVAVVRTVLFRTLVKRKERRLGRDTRNAELFQQLKDLFEGKKKDVAQTLADALKLRTVSFETTAGKPASLVGNTDADYAQLAIPKCRCGAVHEEEEESQAARDARAVANPQALEESKAAFSALHTLLEERFPLLHANLTKHVVNTYSLVYYWKPDLPEGTPLPPAIALAAHQDVVPAADAAEWKHPPFDGVIDDTYVWGRGAVDDKQALIAICEGVEALLKLGFKPKVPVLLLFGHDEELGGYDGAQSISKFLPTIVPKRPDGKKPISFILDEGLFLLSGFVPGMSARVAAVCIAEKGAANVEITASAFASHSSVPRPPTAIGTLAKAILAIADYPFPVHLSSVRRMFHPLLPYISFPLALLFANDWLFSPILKIALARNPVTAALARTTVSPTIVKGVFMPKRRS